jgi:hypothetical protein
MPTLEESRLRTDRITEAFGEPGKNERFRAHRDCAREPPQSDKLQQTCRKSKCSRTGRMREIQDEAAQIQSPQAAGSTNLRAGGQISVMGMYVVTHIHDKRVQYLWEEAEV